MQPVGACVRDNCGIGFTCIDDLCCNSKYLSAFPRCSDGSKASAACYQGGCGQGYTCSMGNLCCRTGNGINYGIYDPVGLPIHTTTTTIRPITIYTIPFTTQFTTITSTRTGTFSTVTQTSTMTSTISTTTPTTTTTTPITTTTTPTTTTTTPTTTTSTTTTSTTSTTSTTTTTTTTSTTTTTTTLNPVCNGCTLGQVTLINNCNDLPSAHFNQIIVFAGGCSFMQFDCGTTASNVASVTVKFNIGAGCTFQFKDPNPESPCTVEPCDVLTTINCVNGMWQDPNGMIVTSAYCSGTKQIGRK